MDNQHNPIRGFSLGTLSADAPRTFPGVRRCEARGCPTMLSRFNPDRRCWFHQVPIPVPLQAPRRAS